MAKDRKPTLTWEREADKDWAASVEIRLALDHDAPLGLADEVLTEAHELVHEEGRPARDLLGDPHTYAQLVADERIPEEHRARIDSHGLTPGERLTASFVSVGISAALYCAFEWLTDGLWIGIGWPSVTLTATVALGVALTGATIATWTAGRLPGARWFAAATIGAVLAGVGVTSLVPDGQLFTVPAPVLILTCLAVVVGAVKFPDTTLDRWFTPAPVDSDDSNDDAWFTRLDGLLRGRHAMPSAQAHGHIREARHHLASTPGDERASDVFGDVEVYALRLSEGPTRTRRFARRQFYGSCALTLFLTVMLIDNLSDPDPSPFWLAANTCSLAAMLWILVNEWRESTTRTTSDPAGPAGPAGSAGSGTPTSPDSPS
ncbi:hypothetical protein [Streptomyces lasiicapitis]|uniref:Uncharacterized protein n=1 Tax=Streptomyces lasiicapitis TaxID=1923961 RepID=A0ABQ2M4L6_9ACTN|nr:hypothetical protein [Streptomyces lasiicapitis]GGO46858.1 hypothetical protein GCM10012286_38750 [Streptomyces lasiicapitis]